MPYRPFKATLIISIGSRDRSKARPSYSNCTILHRARQVNLDLARVLHTSSGGGRRGFAGGRIGRGHVRHDALGGVGAVRENKQIFPIDIDALACLLVQPLVTRHHGPLLLLLAITRGQAWHDLAVGIFDRRQAPVAHV